MPLLPGPMPSLETHDTTDIYTERLWKVMDHVSRIDSFLGRPRWLCGLSQNKDGRWFHCEEVIQLIQEGVAAIKRFPPEWKEEPGDLGICIQGGEMLEAQLNLVDALHYGQLFCRDASALPFSEDDWLNFLTALKIESRLYGKYNFWKKFGTEDTKLAALEDARWSESNSAIRWYTFVLITLPQENFVRQSGKDSLITCAVDQAIGKHPKSLVGMTREETSSLQSQIHAILGQESATSPQS